MKSSENGSETHAGSRLTQAVAVSVVLLVFLAGVFGFIFLVGDDDGDSGAREAPLTADFRTVETDDGSRVILQSTNAEVVYLADVGGDRIDGTEMYEEGEAVTTDRNQFDVVAKSGNRTRVIKTVTGGVTPVR